MRLTCKCGKEYYLPDWIFVELTVVPPMCSDCALAGLRRLLASSPKDISKALSDIISEKEGVE